MMILSGKETAASLDEKSAALCEALKSRGIQPTLAILQIGDDAGDTSYRKGASKRCEKLGIGLSVCQLSAEVSEDEVLAKIEEWNRDEKIHGVLLLRPFPKHMNDERIRSALAPEKDVDGITEGSLAGVFAGTQKGFAPCTAEACLQILDHYGIDPDGKKACVVGRSLVIGRPVAMLLLHRNATVTLCHTHTKDLSARCAEAEILVAAAGKRGAVDAACFAPGQVVLDVGIHVNEEGKLCGDADYAAAEPVVEGITPVPGGVGAVTTAVLALHVLQAAERTL